MAADTDNDGMPDDYEVACGLNANNLADADWDDDGDGFTNLEEFQAGTDPNPSGDRPKIASTEGTLTGEVGVSFTTIPGKKYRVQRNDNFPSGHWITIADNVLGTGAVVQNIDGSAASLTQAVYRVLVLP